MASSAEIVDLKYEALDLTIRAFERYRSLYIYMLLLTSILRFNFSSLRILLSVYNRNNEEEEEDNPDLLPNFRLNYVLSKRCERC